MDKTEMKKKLNEIILKISADVPSIKPTDLRKINELIIKISDLRKITDSSEKSEMRKVNDLVGIFSKNTKSLENPKKIERRRKFHEVILEINSKNPNAWQYIGNGHFVLDNSNKAIESYEKVLKIEPKKFEAWYNMGISYKKIKNFEKAKESFEKAVTINSKSTKTLHHLAIIHMLLGNSIKGREYFKKTIENSSNNSVLWYKLGIVYEKSEKYEEAKESFEKAIAIDTINANARRHLKITKKKINSLKSILTTKFQFLRDDVFLCPWVNIVTGKQKIILQKINLNTDIVEIESAIDCIHTAVTDISTEEFVDYQNYADANKHLNKKTLEIRSSENLKEIKLTPEEKFIALKSWVAGIVEAGSNIFRIQDEIDKNLNLLYPVTRFLLKFMIRVDSDFIPQYIAKIEKECMFEGIKHNSSLMANLIPILELLQYNYRTRSRISQKEKKIIKMLMTMDISEQLFESNPNFLSLRKLVDTK